MKTFVAIDAGGTNTRCWVGDETRVLGRAVGGTVKVMVVGEAAATAQLQELVRAAAAEARVALEDVAGTCIGLSGIGSAGVRQWAETTLGGLVVGEVLVVGDDAIAFEAAFRGGPGVFLIAGTGSIMMGRCSDGRVFGAGGFGPVLGDEGSGGWIGLEGIRAGLRAYDRGEATALLEAVQTFWGLGSLGELIACGNERVRARFAELSGVVAECAACGDAVAADVLRRAGEGLAEQVLLLVSKMRAAGCAPGDCAELAYTGSAVGKIAAVRSAMVAKLPGMRVAEREAEAVEGALWMARRL